MVATREDQREAVQALLQLGADPDLKTRDTNRSACDIAQEMGLQVMSEVPLLGLQVMSEVPLLGLQVMSEVPLLELKV